MDNALQWIVRRLWNIVRWIQERLEDDTMRAALMQELGVEDSTPAPTGPAQSDIDAIEAYLASDDPDVLAFLAVADSVAAVFETYETFLTPIIEGSGSTLGAADALFILVESSAIELMRRDAPALYAWARLLGFIDDKIATHLLPSIDLKGKLDRIREVGLGDALEDAIEDGFRRLWSPLDTEEQARRHADILHVTALGLAYMPRLLKEDCETVRLAESVLVGWDPAVEPFGDPLPDLDLADSISSRAVTIVLRARPSDATSAALSTTWVTVPAEHGGPGLFLSLGGELTLEVEGRSQRFKVEADLLEGLSFFLVPGGREIEGAAGAGLEVEYVRTGVPDGSVPGGRRPAVAFPRGTGSRAEIGSFGAGFVARSDEVVAKLIFDRTALVLSSEDPDSFLATVFPAGGVRVDFDLSLGWDFLEGHLFLGGSAKLEVVIPIGKPLGPLTIFHITIGIGVAEDDDTTLELALRLSLSLKLFAVTGVVDQIGYRMALPSRDTGGRLGLFDDPEFGFVPPKGIGLQVGGAGVRGGGFLFFDPDNDEYAGVLSLEFQRVTLKVVGLIKTNLEASPSFALLLIGSVEDLRISIFAGGFLTGIGIIFAMHRTMSVPALQAGVKNRTLDAILFPEDPVANAPQLLQTLKSVFPVAPDQWIVGVSLQASWIDKRMVKIEVALIFEFPSPFRIALLGQANLGLPTRRVGLVQVNFDIVGIIDFDNRFLSIDSVLHDSRIGKFPMSGGLAARANWGDDPALAVAAGGLHPRFPLPHDFPKLARLAVSIGKGKNPRIQGRAYVGFTTNTIQFGIGAELYAAAGGFSVEGDFSFDVLFECVFECDPFRFLAELSFRASVKFKGRTLAGLKVTGSLTGPGRWRAKGKVRIKILFLKVTKSFNHPWGDEQKQEIQAVEVRAPLEDALTDPDSWRAQLPSGGEARVSLRPAPPADVVEVHPLGALEVVQRVVPLGVELDKFMNAPIAGERRFDIESARLNGIDIDPEPVREHFAPGQYLDIGEGDAAVSRPSFERFKAGARLSPSGGVRGPGITTNFEYEEIVINERTDRLGILGIYQIPAAAVMAGAEHGAVARGLRSTAGPYRGPSRAVERVDSGFVAATVAGLTELALEGSLPDDATYTEVLQGIERYVTANPEARGRVQVVRPHERRTS